MVAGTILAATAWMSFMAAAFGSTKAQGDNHSRAASRSTGQPAVRVVSILATPYLMKKPDGQMEGFVPDLLENLRQRLELEFSIYLVPDGRYGTKLANGTWNGMIGEVIKRENGDPSGADLAAAPLTVTAEREKIINFIYPFQNMGLSVLIKRPQREARHGPVWEDSLDIFRPLSPSLWACCLAAFLVVSVMLWGMNRLNPYEWRGRFSLGRATKTDADIFRFSGAIWFTFSTLQWQGYEKSPRSTASRVLVGCWFLFVSVTLLTYTGSLVNQLFWASTVHGQEAGNTRPPIQDIEHLVMASDYDYGTVLGGSTMNYLNKTARGDMFDKMRNYWSTERGRQALVTSTKEGVQAVREKEKYALIIESMSAMHEANQAPCDVMTVGDIIGQRSYAMAVANNTDPDIMEGLHAAILEAIEDGDITALEQKWFVDRGQCGNVTQAQKDILRRAPLYLNKPKRVTLRMFMGPLVMLSVGLVLAVLVGFGERFYFLHKSRKKYNVRPSQRFNAQ